MKVSIAVLLTVVAPYASAAPCPRESAPEIANSFMSAMISPDCAAKLHRLVAPPGWIRACKRGLGEPDSDAKQEFALRMSFHYTELREAPNGWLAEGVLRQPDPIEFAAQLGRRFGCGGAGGWTSYKPPNQKCGPIDWALIPMIETRSGVRLQCVASKWRVVDLD